MKKFFMFLGLIILFILGTICASIIICIIMPENFEKFIQIITQYLIK